MDWLFYIILGIFCVAWIGFAIVLSIWIMIVFRYLQYVVRIFQERPIFAIPRGSPPLDANDIVVETPNGKIKACYLPSHIPRKGVVLFGIEYGANRWSSQHHAEFLRNGGYDVISWEPRGQGESDKVPGYQPLHWVSEYEVEDALAVIEYACGRPDADPRGVALVGISKGAGVGVVAASRGKRVVCCVTDGMFGVYTTVVPYMRHWIKIYSSLITFQKLMPDFFYGTIGILAFRRVEKIRNCRFPSLESALGKIRSIPLLMIHGDKDTYIRVGMAQSLFAIARGSKGVDRILWLAPGARHNEALAKHPLEYSRKVLAFLDKNLANSPSSQGE